MEFFDDNGKLGLDSNTASTVLALDIPSEGLGIDTAMANISILRFLGSNDLVCRELQFQVTSLDSVSVKSALAPVPLA